MPTVPQQTADRSQAAKEPTDFSRPFTFHGVALEDASGGNKAGDCPFCGREGKLSVSAADGQWHCFVCGEKGNVASFLQRLHKISDESTKDYSEMLADRKLLDEMTLMKWSVVKSVLTGEWMVPGWNADGKLCQLYKRVRIGPRWEMRPTPTVGHHLLGVPLFDHKKPIVYLHESWGNAMAFWEVLRQAKRDADGSLKLTASEHASLCADANVLSVANCGAAGKGLERYAAFFAGRCVVLMFDSDHPRTHNGVTVPPAGAEAARRVVGVLAGLPKPPLEVLWLKWGVNGFDPAKKSGYDVRDHLTGGA